MPLGVLVVVNILAESELDVDPVGEVDLVDEIQVGVYLLLVYLVRTHLRQTKHHLLDSLPGF